MASTAIQWRVQVKAKTGNWINKGLFETRAVARVHAKYLRGLHTVPNAKNYVHPGYGFGNTRVVRYERRGK